MMKLQELLSTLVLWAQTLKNLKSETLMNYFKRRVVFFSKSIAMLVCGLLTLAATSFAQAPPNSVTALSAGSGYTCAVVNSGVQCVGFNETGQLGNSSAVFGGSRIPLQSIVADSKVTAISALSGSTCAVVNGGAQCWGFSGYSLGSNVRTTDNKIQSIPAGSNVTAVSAGDMHGCAVVNGGVQCWGNNFQGQLGDNTQRDGIFPVQSIPPGSNVTAVSAGGAHSCAVVNGGVQCWGNNFNGELGNNSATLSRVPVQAIAAGSNVTAISAGFGFSCAVANGGVKCWGFNGDGRLGNNSTTNSRIPVQVIADGSNVTAVSANYHACAVVNGGVQCWGNNSYGQLGNNTATNSLVPVETVPAGSNVTVVSAGGTHSCAVVAGDVRCWGFNIYGQLGNNSTTSSLIPVRALFTAALPLVVSAVSPSNGPAGTLITISGTGLAGATVTIGGIPAVVTAGSSTSLQVTVPSLPPGQATVLITTSVGTINSAFTVTASTSSYTINTTSSPSVLTGLWWNANESGWGLTITQQYGVIFVAIYTYDTANNPIWYVITNCPVVAGGCTGDIFKVNGGSPLTSAWRPNLALTKVGIGTLAFSDNNTATMNFTIDGIAGSKAITRQVFATAP